MNYFQKRRIRKMSRNVLHHAGHVRNMRRDIMGEGDLARLVEAEQMLVDAINRDDIARMESVADALYEFLCRVVPPRPLARWREDFEVLVVAVAVAMAIKAYFIQPFKIPTGSMQPTLYGVTVLEDGYEPGIWDVVPFRYVKWFLTGESYKKVVVREDGYFTGWYDVKNAPGSDIDLNPVYKYCVIGGRKYKIPESASVMVALNNKDLVSKGTVLWAGVMRAGDHVFVDKVSWNFRKPRRGEIMVFETSQIPQLARSSRGAHYIKRLVGLPGETIAIYPPCAIIDGDKLDGPPEITRIQEKEPGYWGYRTTHLRPERMFGGMGNGCLIPEDSYVVLGDNTLSSLDSRYWGTVPKASTLGPAFWVYWPFLRRDDQTGGYYWQFKPTG